MSERTQPVIADDLERCAEPANAFSVVANETRLSILMALWRADGVTSFTDLHRAVGLRDSAQFNYHLQKLTDAFVRPREGGYELRYAGEKVVRAVLSGSFVETPAIEPFALDASCVACGRDLRARYADEQFSIDCVSCGTRFGRYPFPPGGFTDRTRAEVMDAFNQRVRHLHCLAADGVCHECNGRMRTRFVRDDERFAAGVSVTHRCEQCRHRLHSPIGLTLLDHSGVVAFHREHGVDLCRVPYWRLAWCVGDDALTVLSEDPWEVRIDVSLGDETLSVWIDETLAVTAMDRTGD
ncbi:ArsR/SmtB family transcription factor [Natronorarus salvus]|uniref:ArsR/SmtB family transcription factor n=1 Tax=Natronorarus salvus TaxID=3117733 RepID=UPI002F26780E